MQRARGCTEGIGIVKHVQRTHTGVREENTAENAHVEGTRTNPTNKTNTIGRARSRTHDPGLRTKEKKAKEEK